MGFILLAKFWIKQLNTIRSKLKINVFSIFQKANVLNFLKIK